MLGVLVQRGNFEAEWGWHSAKRDRRAVPLAPSLSLSASGLGASRPLPVRPCEASTGGHALDRRAGPLADGQAGAGRAGTSHIAPVPWIAWSTAFS
jgi:hypothetical protein